MTTNTPDDYAYNARELGKAAPQPGETDHDKLPRIKAWGPKGESRTLVVDASQYARVIEALTTDPGITYRVQPHDITTLTWPMWDACGIECPAMIGADCYGRIKRRNADGFVMACPGWSAKFSNAATEVVYGWSMHWQPETCGDVDQPIGCNHLFRAAGEDDDTDGPMGAGVILSTDSQGFVSLVRYGTLTELDGIWSMLQDEEAKYDRANCEDCAEGEPCDDHDDDDVPEYERHEPHRFDDGSIVPEGAPGADHND